MKALAFLLPVLSGRIGLRGVLAALLVAAVLPSTALAADTIGFGDQGASATFGANAIVRIDGTITYASDCPEPGIDDFFYPATDVYLVPAGSAGGELQDAGGGRPNTIVSGASAFLDEVIAVTAPAGSLDEGTYDVVYDTCQDGQLDPGRDTVFPSAVTVRLPDVLPLADAAIRELKDEARSEYASWVATRHAMSGIFKLADRALKVQCKAGNAVGCAMKRVDYFDGVKERFLGLLLSQANHYLAIAEDPPDRSYETPTTLGAIEVPRGHNDSALGNATADALRPLAGEAALSAALLKAVERYQGAQAAGDGEWALVHARQARNLAETLRESVLASGDALDELRSTVAGEAAELDAALTRGHEFARRVLSTGLSPDERRALLNRGSTAGQIADLETELRGFAYGEDANVDAGSALAALDQARSAHVATAAALVGAAAEWDDIVAALEADGPDPGPAIAAGGPYGAGEGTPLQLDGSAAGQVESASWDLDGDGGFDDADGLRPTVSFAEAGAYVIGLRATEGGRESVSYALVTVADTNRAPVLSSPAPAERSATVVVGDELTLSVEASDPDGDTIAYSWRIDGADAGASGASLELAPTSEQVGVHDVDVTASDGAAAGSTRRTWTVVVLAPDGDGDGWTATTDCDEADPAVHPSANELLGNGSDDDCDPGTADAPPGGLTGSMWSWGSNHNGSVGSGSFSPQIVQAPVSIPGYDDVVGVKGGDRTGFAVLASGEARGWGFNGTYELGTGTVSSTSSPVSPLSVSGGPGPLAGVTQIASSGGHTVARRADGSVVGWGENRAGQVGDGSTADARPFPVQTLTGPDGPPLTGVRSVEAGYVESYAVMDDGTVRAWGQIRCDGGSNVRIERFPVPLSLVGDGVRQVSSGNQWLLVLKKDGTVLSCGALPPVAGRPVAAADIRVPKPVTGLGAGSSVIDVSAGFEGGLALKDDGSVWAWGYNGNGSLSAAGVALGASAPAPVEIQLPPGPPVVDIDMDGACHALALRADGSVLSWGCDYFGQVGNGVGPASGIVATPTVIELPGASAYAVAASIWNSLVLTRPAADPGWERPATWVKASVADATVGEAGGTFAVDLSAELPHDVTVEWAVVEGGTAGGADVELGEGTATVPAGARTVEVGAPVLDDALDEDDETFTIVLREASHGIRLARSQATVTIADDDGPPSVGVVPATVAEGDTSLTDAVVSVRLSEPSGKPVEVSFATADGDATSPGDYEPASGRLVIEPGQQEAVVHLAVRGDAAVEPDEALTLALSDPENATLGAASGTLTIADDEPLALAVTSPTVPEGNEGTTPATFTVALEPAPPAGTTVTVDYHLAGVTASVPGDVEPATGTLVFEPGESSKQVSVAVQGDLEAEPDEAFRLVLAGAVATGGRTVLAGESAVATVLDDDADGGGGGGTGFEWSGYLVTFQDAPVLNTAHASGVQTFWFRLGGDFGLDVLQGAPQSRRIDCSTFEPLGQLEPAATPSWDAFGYQAHTGRYYFPWKTTSAFEKTCREFVLTLSDGSSHSAYLEFVK
ncbi:MAG TPA: Calx-beta domain-containing protein [Gaiellaceae bacterium]|nr:Calx-beta domain-containing protein [Gaiellaceae bacterium]